MRFLKPSFRIFKYSWQTTRTLKLPKSICIGAIYKDDEIIIPNGDTIIDINDIIIVFAENLLKN